MISRKSTVGFIGALALSASACFCWGAEGFSVDGTSRSPNVLFILADDLGWADTTLYGQTSFYKTPNIQRLADRGMLFTRAYSANPLCSPTRSSILSGINPARTGFTSAAGHVETVRIDKKVNASGPAWAKACGVSQITRLDVKYVTLAEALKSAGYATGHFGKWHVGFNRPGHPEDHFEPKDQGFDVDIPSVPHASGPLGGYTASFSKFPSMGVWEPDSPDANVEDFICDEAINYMQAHRDEPFFLNYWAYSVHAPFDSKPELVEKYTKEVDPYGTQRYPVYAAMVEVFDDTVGRLLDALDRLGIAENTIVVFYSDNGGNMYDKRDGYPVTSNAPLRGGKASIYEGGSRIPAAVIWPGEIKPGSSTDALISSTDWYPTLLEMAGIEKPAGVRLDGVSQVPALLGKSAPRKRLLNHFPHYFPVVPNEPSAYLIEGDWKLIRYYCKSDDQKDVFELYNLKDDLSESRDLAAQYPERVERMKQQMANDLSAMEADIPVSNPNYNSLSPKPGLLQDTKQPVYTNSTILLQDGFDDSKSGAVSGTVPDVLAPALAGRKWVGSSSIGLDGAGHAGSSSLNAYSAIGFDLFGAVSSSDILRLTVVVQNDEGTWAGIGFARAATAGNMGDNTGWVNLFGDAHSNPGSGNLWEGPGPNGSKSRLMTGLWEKGAANTVVLEYNLNDDGDGNGFLAAYVNGTLGGTLLNTLSVGLPKNLFLAFNNNGGTTAGGPFFDEVKLEIVSKE